MAQRANLRSYGWVSFCAPCLPPDQFSMNRFEPRNCLFGDGQPHGQAPYSLKNRDFSLWKEGDVGRYETSSEKTVRR